MKTTHIGSLPFYSIDEAIDFNRGLSLPALPTIPKHFENEWMISQFKNGFMDKDHELPFSCLEKFLSTFKEKIKIQVCGIQTLYNNSPKDIEKEEFKNWYQAVVNNFLKKIPNELVLFFDEPDLRDIDRDLWSVYAEFSSNELGIHSCAKLDWSKLDIDSFSHISFDSRISSIDNINFLKSQKKVLYFGIYTTDTGEFIEEFSGADFITPTCGLAFSTLDVTEKIRKRLSVS